MAHLKRWCNIYNLARLLSPSRPFLAPAHVNALLHCKCAVLRGTQPPGCSEYQRKFLSMSSGIPRIDVKSRKVWQAVLHRTSRRCTAKRRSSGGSGTRPIPTWEPPRELGRGYITTHCENTTSSACQVVQIQAPVQSGLDRGRTSPTIIDKEHVIVQSPETFAHEELKIAGFR